MTQGLRARLTSADEEVRRAAVVTLDGGEDALGLLVEAMGDVSWRVRKEAVARAAAWPRPERAAAALVAALSEPDNIGRRNAAIDALGRLGATAVQPLIAALATRPAHRKLVVDALGTIGDARAVGPLGRLLDDADENVRVAVAEALGKIGGPAAVRELDRALGRGELMLSLACLDALNRLGAQVSVAKLEGLLPKPALRPAVVEALGTSRDPAAVPYLVPALGATARTVRLAAMTALSRLHGTLPERGRRLEEEVTRQFGTPAADAAERFLVESLTDASLTTRRTAAWLLGLARRPTTLRPLGLALGDPEIAESASEALTAFGERSIGPLCALSADLDSSGRARLVTLLRRLGAQPTDPQVQALLASAAIDPDPELSAAANKTLAAWKTGNRAAATQKDTDSRMTDEEFRLIRTLVNEHCGILFDAESKFIVERRLTPRLQTLGLATFLDYYRHLKFSADRRNEYEEVVERLTTNETYFFRERYQLDAFEYEILPRIHALSPRGRHLTIWSAGCATGEEAYTIAILIKETGLFEDWDVRVFGNDISRRVLSVARKASYGRASFRQTDERLLRRYFAPLPDGRYEVRPEIRDLVSFYQANLLEEQTLSMIGEADVVFCRNVLMYLDVESRRRVIDMFHRKLVRGGFLCLGHTDSLINLSTAFELVHLQHDMVYRKP